jgi:hypothetical protein
MRLTEKHVVRAAVQACRSFAKCSPNFFNFEESANWRGWENWLTVEIARRLDSRCVLAFFAYPKKKLRLDLFVKGNALAVEIKTNFITDREAAKENRTLPDRVVKDAKKMRALNAETGRLILVATIFDTREGLVAYKRTVNKDLAPTFVDYRVSWHDCSSGEGHLLLLALIKPATQK